jgi:uncharacterized protein (DUF58 family)
MDFDESRFYQMGDDIRSIDWRVTARTGEAHTKIYREERERPVFVIVDQSASMMFGSRQQFKSVLAAKIASTIMWRTLNDGNRFGALLFDGKNHVEHKPSSNRKNCLRALNSIVDVHNKQIARQYLSDQPVTEQTNPLTETLARARHIARPGSLIYVLSDFLSFDADCEHHLLRIAQNNDVNLIHVNDPLETELPPPGFYTITDGKNRSSFDSSSNKMRRAFKHHYQKQNTALKELCKKHRVKWFGVSTTDNVTSLMASTNKNSDKATA